MDNPGDVSIFKVIQIVIPYKNQDDTVSVKRQLKDLSSKVKKKTSNLCLLAAS